jgi:hypothetical protein
MNAILPNRIQKARRRESRWRSQAHTKHVRSFACANCGTTANVEAAHYRFGSHTGMGQKPDDWRTTPLCGGPEGCHTRQGMIGEPKFWADYAKKKGHTVHQLIEELIRTSPKRAEIERIRRERETA